MKIPTPRPIVGALAVSLLTASPVFALTHLTATIDGAQPVPPTGSPGTGTAHALIDTGTNTLYYHIDFSGLSGTETVSHIHGYAAAGASAGVVHGLATGSPKIGVWNYAEVDEASILGGLTYVNIHSTVSPGGEIRGQLEVDTGTDMVAIIDPMQVVPPVVSNGQGIGVFDVDTAANTVDYDIRFGGMTTAELQSHIHGFAPPGMIASPLITLPNGSPKIGTWNYLEASEANILAGLSYVNIHTVMVGSGEIRGQILAVTGGPVSSPLVSGEAAAGLTASPNPVPNGASVALFFSRAAAGAVDVTIHDVSGRTVRTLSGVSDATGMLAWDTRGNDGQHVPAGVYFARLEGQAERTVSRVVVLR